MRGLVSLLYPAQDRGTVMSDEQSAALDKRLSDDLDADFTSILSKSADAVSAILKDAKAAKTNLEIDIAGQQEKLRQTNIVIAAFEPVLKALEDGYDPADDAAKSYDAAITAKRERGDKHYPRRADGGANILTKHILPEPTEA